MDVPPGLTQFSDNETALKQIDTSNIQDNLDLTCRNAPTRQTHINSIPEVTETLQSINMDSHFPRLLPLCTDYSKDLQLKTRQDVSHQKFINKIIDQLNSKTMHFYNLPFVLLYLTKKSTQRCLFHRHYIVSRGQPPTYKCQMSKLYHCWSWALFALQYFTVSFHS